MARETRIGLVVGMGFIICFAVILSHRGQPPASSAQSFDVTDSGHEAQPLVNTQLAEQRARRLGQGREPAPQTRAQTEHQSRQPVMAGAEDRAAHSAEDFVLPRRDPLSAAGNDDSGDRPAEANASRPDRFTARGEPIEVGTPPPATPPQVQTPADAALAKDSNRTPTAASDDSQPLVLRMPPRLDAAPQSIESAQGVLEAVANMPVTLSDAGAESARRAPSPTDDEPFEPAVREVASAGTPTLNEPQVSGEATQGEKYTIQPGDTLTRIAQVRYGTCAPDVLEAIFEANRDMMRSPDHIVVGRTIMLPLIDGQDDGGQSVPVEEPKPAPAPITPLKKVKPAYAFVYEIQPGDTLGKIASRHYGSAAPRIIDAICASNAQSIPSRDKVVVGRKINLPEIEGLSGPGAVDAEPKPDDDMASALALDVQFDEPVADVSTESANAEGIEWRWYQLQKGDVYSRVAAKHLGSSKRWKELAELNKDIFPDPAHIRHGVQIRVPIEEGGDGSGEEYGKRG